LELTSDGIEPLNYYGTVLPSLLPQHGHFALQGTIGINIQGTIGINIQGTIGINIQGTIGIKLS
jgi:hypothetical protein